jgi:hypothetical protein
VPGAGERSNPGVFAIWAAPGNGTTATAAPTRRVAARDALDRSTGYVLAAGRAAGWLTEIK